MEVDYVVTNYADPLASFCFAEKYERKKKIKNIMRTVYCFLFCPFFDSSLGARKEGGNHRLLLCFYGIGASCFFLCICMLASFSLSLERVVVESMEKDLYDFVCLCLFGVFDGKLLR